IPVIPVIFRIVVLAVALRFGFLHTLELLVLLSLRGLCLGLAVRAPRRRGLSRESRARCLRLRFGPTRRPFRRPRGWPHRLLAVAGFMGSRALGWRHRRSP